MNKTIRNIILLSTVAISFAMHFNHFTKDLMSVHVWRQTQTQSTIINFYEEDMNILNPRKNDRGDTDGIFRMEFPLMQWMVAGMYKLFGNHLIISRGFMFLIGIFSVLGIYKLLMNLFRQEYLALIGAWAFTFSPSFYYYTINPLPDNMALCCAIWGMALFFGWYSKRRLNSLIFSGLFLSIAALCKLPFIIYFIVPAVYFSHTFYKNRLDKKSFIELTGAFGFAILPLAWYAWVVPQWHGNLIMKGVLNNNESMINLLDYMQHILISTLPELLVNYGSMLFFVAGFYFLYKQRKYKNSKFPLILGLSIVVLLYYFFEANAIAKVHDYYLFPFYPLIFILVAYGGYHLLISQKAFLRYLTIILLLILPLTCHLRMQNRWNPDKPGINKDLLTYKSVLQNAVPKDALVVAGNDESHFILFYYIDKKGWGFDNDDLSFDKLKSMIDNGAKYLYTDSDAIATDKEIASCYDELILERGTVKIFSLKAPDQIN